MMTHSPDCIVVAGMGQLQEHVSVPCGPCGNCKQVVWLCLSCWKHMALASISASACRHPACTPVYQMTAQGPALTSAHLLTPHVLHVLYSYRCPQNMLLKRLWEVQQQQERERQQQQEEQQAAAGSSGMDVDGQAAAAPLQRAGIVQRELVDWFITQQLQR